MKYYPQAEKAIDINEDSYLRICPYEKISKAV